MHNSYLHPFLTIAFGVAGIASSAAAQAPASGAEDNKASCIAAFEQAQQDRAASKLIASKEQARRCFIPACGAALMAECTQMYTELERAIPSVVLSAREEVTRSDLTAVVVTMDGEPLTSDLDGKPILVDPGEHEFVFSARGYVSVARRALIGTGDKYRLIEVVFPSTELRRVTASEAEPAPVHRVPLGTYVLGGVGVVGLGTFGILRLVADSDFDSLKNGCAEVGCPESDISNLHQKYVFSNVALGVGAAGVAGAVIWYLLDVGPAPSAEVAVAPTAGGALATARAAF